MRLHGRTTSNKIFVEKVKNSIYWRKVHRYKCEEFALQLNKQYKFAYIKERQSIRRIEKKKLERAQVEETRVLIAVNYQRCVD